MSSENTMSANTQSQDIRETDTPTPEEQQQPTQPIQMQSAQTQQQQQQQQMEMIPVPRDQYQALLAANMRSVTNTLNTLDTLDKIIGSLNNLQGWVMNFKEKVKKDQLAIGQPEPSQQQQQYTQ